jgi:hypothetical protein
MKHELIIGRVLHQHGDDPAMTSSAGTLNGDSTIFLVLHRAEKPNVRLIAGVAPSVLADGFLVDVVPSEEVPLNSHMAPNA